jgi:hypothetical protein
MSELREIREHLPHGGRGRERAKELLRTDPTKNTKVDASGYSPPDALDADVKTGARPLRARLYKRGGAVKVHGEKKHHAGRKPRKSGGKAVVDDYSNRDVREANEEREGSKHVGAFRRGGKAHKADGGSFVPTQRMAFSGAGESRLSKAAGLARGGHADAAEDMAMIKRVVKAKALKSHGGSLNVTDGEQEGTRPKGGRIVRASGGLIKPRHTKGKTHINININPEHKPANLGMPMPPPNQPPPPMPKMMPPPAGATPMPPMGGAPPSGPMPPPMAGGPPPANMMPRKSGGRTVKASEEMEDGIGSGGGLGRLAKIKAYGHPR